MSPSPACLPLVIPAGVVVLADGTLCHESGAPLSRGLKLVNGQLVVAKSGAKLPKSKTCHHAPSAIVLIVIAAAIVVSTLIVAAT